jgi:hypothetical protein
MECTQVKLDSFGRENGGTCSEQVSKFVRSLGKKKYNRFFFFSLDI